MNIKKVLLVIVGSISLAVGAIGAVMPLLPAFPFLVLATVCFAKSSKRLESWFKGTKLYINNVEPFLDGKGLTIKAKVKIMLIVTVVLAISFFMMKNVLIGRIAVSLVWIFHMLWFIFKIKTRRVETEEVEEI